MKEKEINFITYHPIGGGEACIVVGNGEGKLKTFEEFFIAP